MDDKVREALDRLALKVQYDVHPHYATICAHIEALEADKDKAIRQREHTVEWYAVRWERIRDFAKEHGWWDKAAAILANGTLTMTDGVVYEPPTYVQQLNMAKHRAEAAEARVRELEGLLSQSRYGVEYTRDVIKQGCDNWHYCNQLLAAIDSAMQGEEARGG